MGGKYTGNVVGVGAHGRGATPRRCGGVEGGTRVQAGARGGSHGGEHLTRGQRGGDVGARPGCGEGVQGIHLSGAEG